MHVHVDVPGLWVMATGELDAGAQQAPTLERVPVDAKCAGYVGCLPLGQCFQLVRLPHFQSRGWATSELG